MMKQLQATKDFYFPISLIDTLLLLLGSIVYMWSEFSFRPIVVALIFFTFGWSLVFATNMKSRWERRIYTRVFSTGFLAASVASVYQNYSSGFSNDQVAFFERIFSTLGLTLDQISGVSEGALVIFIWSEIYGFMRTIGVNSEVYIGVLFNLLCVSFSSVIVLKMARLIFGEDHSRFSVLRLVIASCGGFWLFSALLLRDAFVLLSVCVLNLAYVYFLVYPNIRRLMCLVLCNSLAFYYCGYLRTEFYLLPIATTLALCAAIIVKNVNFNIRSVVFSLSVLLGVLYTFMNTDFANELVKVVNRGSENYMQEASYQNTQKSSLGYRLIVDQPLPVRILFGVPYLMIFPVPFWVGFQLDSSYHLFKSLHVLYSYFLIPLMLLGLAEVIINLKRMSLAILYITFSSAGFLVAVVASSIETRHWLVFYMSALIIALIPDFRLPHVKMRYKKLTAVIFASIIVLHLAWSLAK